jgi:hypothetical protein
MHEESVTWRRKAKNLLQSVRDVVPEPCRQGDEASTYGSSLHLELFRNYVRELGESKRGADNWWEALIRTEEERTHDHELAIQNVKHRRKLGPVAHPFIIGTVRKFWLQCVAINVQVTAERCVDPEMFVLGWLATRGQEAYAAFLSDLPFWPLGIDWDERWI